MAPPHLRFFSATHHPPVPPAAMHPNVNLKGLDATEDAFTFRETRSDCVFSPWDAEEISTSATFSIADAVADLETLHLGDNEDLAELDSGPPHIPLPTGSDTLVQPSHIKFKTPSQIARTTQEKARSKAKRQAARSANSKTDVLLEECPRHPCHLRTAGPSIEAQFNLRKVRIAATGWISLRDNGVSPEEAEAGVKQEGYTPIHLLPDFGIKAIFHGFHLAKYLGPFTSHPAKAVPLLTNVARSAPFLGGALPRMTSWRRCTTQPWKRWKRHAQCSLADKRLLHRRGNWAPLTKGASFGGGQTKPGELLNTAVLCCLVSNLAFIRCALPLLLSLIGPAESLQVEYMRLFYSHYPRLCRPFLNGIWSAVTFNLGLERTTILIPSAAIFHSNIPVAEGKHRYSFTQYTAGGLFRWVEHGFKTKEEYLEGLSKRERREEQELDKERASEGVGIPPVPLKIEAIPRFPWADFVKNCSANTENSLLKHLSPIRTLAARRKACAEYRDRNKEELAEKARIRMTRYCQRIKKNKNELGQYSAKGGKITYCGWKQYVRRIEAVASQHHKTGTQKSQGPRNYEVEWEGYKDRKREELQRRVADALYKENEGLAHSRSARTSLVAGHQILLVRASKATTPASALAPPASPTPTGLHYAMREVESLHNAAGEHRGCEPTHHAAHFAVGRDHEEAQALANGEHVVDRLFARPVFWLGSSPLHVLAEHGQTLIWELRDVLRELTIVPHEGEDSDDLLGDDEDTVSLTSIHMSPGGQNEDF
ncbi:hypothetical protein DFH09DRAFT_1082300 [Mycena vulgaris]|nr:hypothetical protein DFH09DRAFT_1082300 [Mycena vulgaris]